LSCTLDHLNLANLHPTRVQGNFGIFNLRSSRVGSCESRVQFSLKLEYVVFPRFGFTGNNFRPDMVTMNAGGHRSVGSPFQAECFPNFFDATLRESNTLPRRKVIDAIWQFGCITNSRPLTAPRRMIDNKRNKCRCV
jgi:hypothetical protein